MKPTHIRIEDFDYPLPNERIAKFPLDDRDQSKLLWLSDGKLSERRFNEIPNLLPPKSLLVFNETRVIRARMRFRKNTGALIEVFCLEPISPSSDFQLAFQESSPVVWKCLVGNAKRWKSGALEMPLEFDGMKGMLKAEVKERLSDSFLIQFSWEPGSVVFSDIVEHSGSVPLPPYLNREAVESDKKRYQTIYALNDGSVAAPTAGLHFTSRQFEELESQNISTAKVTLHVGAGTFKPVISSQISDHDMHAEKIVVPMATLRQLRAQLGNPIIPVGTTSMRTLESLYWLGLNLESGNGSFYVNQWAPYQGEHLSELSSEKALDALISYLEQNGLEELKAETRIMIAPGYKFRLCTGLVTNFHQPKSTLLLLVSALIGNKWKTAYDFALDNNFRFLSYGDSCLFLP